MAHPVTYARYLQDLGQGKFSGLRCNSCNAVTFPPQAVCRGCSGSDLEPTQLKGEGTLRTFTVIRVAPQGMKPPYVVAMVELDEGPYVVGNLVDFTPDKADMGLIGKRVRLGSKEVQGDAFSPGEFRAVTFSLI